MLVFLLVAGASLATGLDAWFQRWAGNRAGSANLLAVALGDGRKLFASHFYRKADAYFHRGSYPSIFEARPPEDEAHMAGNAEETAHDHDHAGCHSEQPQDWIEAFGRHFHPTAHAHLGDGHGETSERTGGEVREILPWLRLTAALDPEQPDTYVVAAYWLRSELGKVKEAAQFLREGLRACPGHPELLFELGRIYSAHHHDPARARNLWELAARNWRLREAGQPDPDTLVYIHTLGSLAKLEEQAQNYELAIQHLRAVLPYSHQQNSITNWIHMLEERRGRR
jgi:tetratricopeptide (TPR) repeat protein